MGFLDLFGALGGLCGYLIAVLVWREAVRRYKLVVGRDVEDN